MQPYLSPFLNSYLLVYISLKSYDHNFGYLPTMKNL